MAKKNLITTIRNAVIAPALIGFGVLANYTGQEGKDLQNKKFSNPEYKQIESRIDFREEINEKISLLEGEIKEVQRLSEDKKINLSHLIVNDESRFWSNFNRPDVYSKEAKELLKQLSPANQVTFGSALPFISLIKKAEAKYDLSKENVLLPLVIIATESGGNCYVTGAAKEAGLGQFIVGGAKNAGFNIDPRFEKYFIRNIERYKEDQTFGPIVIANTLSDLAKENKTNIFEEFQKLGEYDERLNVEKSIDCIVKNISTILRLNKGNVYKLITHYNAGPGRIPRFDLICKYNGGDGWIDYDNERIKFLFEKVKEHFLLGEETSVFPRQTISYIRNYKAFKKAFYNDKDWGKVQDIINMSDSFYDELLKNYKEVYKDFFSKRLAVFEYIKNGKNPKQITDEYSEKIDQIKNRIKYGENDFSKLWDIKEKVTKMNDSFNEYKKYFFKINE